MDFLFIEKYGFGYVVNIKMLISEQWIVNYFYDIFTTHLSNSHTKKDRPFEAVSLKKILIRLMSYDHFTDDLVF